MHNFGKFEKVNEKLALSVIDIILRITWNSILQNYDWNTPALLLLERTSKWKREEDSEATAPHLSHSSHCEVSNSGVCQCNAHESRYKLKIVYNI